ncbi:FAD/NAD-P-binding domain-containing protein [Hymenopellis radicata]|nr:FAD/NAD-P-binding domain-containing protein [Hymenopellis radicata]
MNIQAPSRLPESATVLIVGAGPVGLITAISLCKRGIRDIVIVDAQHKESYGYSSRASMLHAATLEALDTIGCAEPLVSVGVKSRGLLHYEYGTSFPAVEMSSLKDYTPFPFALLLPQSMTEEIFTKHLAELGVQVHRPYRAVGMKPSASGGLEVTFESGNMIRADYVVGADGSHSVIREVSGIPFRDPENTGTPAANLVQQLVHADVVFSGSDPLTSPIYLETNISPHGVLMTIPLPPSYTGPIPLGPNEYVRRLAFNVPGSEGTPPPAPPLEYVQENINRKGPARMSSDLSVNPRPIHVERLIWSSRYKMRYAVADSFAKRVVDEGGNGGLVILVGDAAHTHSPQGGQGMNLGLRDAIFLVPILAEHIDAPGGNPLDKDMSRLEQWAANRRERALNTIRMTKKLGASTNNVMTSNRFMRFVTYWVWRLISSVPFVRTMVAWRFSGLGNR